MQLQGGALLINQPHVNKPLSSLATTETECLIGIEIPLFKSYHMLRVDGRIKDDCKIGNQRDTSVNYLQGVGMLVPNSVEVNWLVLFQDHIWVLQY